MLILSAPQAAFGFASLLLLAFLVFKSGSDGLKRAILVSAAVISAYAAAFAYFYGYDGELFVGGFTAHRAGLLVFVAACFMVLFSLRSKKYGHYYFPAMSAVMFVFALSIYSTSITAMAAGFFVIDMFALLAGKKETETENTLNEKALSDKLPYFVIAAAFLMLYAAMPHDAKLARFAFNGMLVMLILSAATGFFVSTNIELIKFKQPFMASGTVLGFIPVLAQFAVITALIGLNRELLLGSYLSLVVLVLLLLAAYKSVTEEKYLLFALRDIHILFYLGIFGAVSSLLNPFHIAVYGALMALAAVLAADAATEPQSAKLTMSGVRYSFGKIPENWNIFFSMFAGFSAEVFMIVLICQNITGGPVTRAAAMIGAAFYAPALLNKLFTLLSMAARIKVDLKRGKLLNVGRVIMALFLCMVSAMLYKW